MLHEKRLQGHSGCQINLIEINNRVIVRKTSANLSYNIRLFSQFEKQNGFISTNSYIKTPRIFDSGYNEEGLFYFDMEYINGLTLSEYIGTVNVGNIKNYASAFMHHLADTMHYEYDPGACEIFSKKIDGLESSIMSTKDIDFAIQILRAVKWRYMITNICHGDLTFENVIVKHDELYLIDFLDSFYNSWIIDAAKLMQDTEVIWSYRAALPIDENLEIRLLIFKKYFLNKLMKCKDSEFLLPTIYAVLLINLLRIVPYTKNQGTFNFVNNSIKSVTAKLTEFRPFNF